ncbi:DUF1028 domain-containing protein [Pararhodobacter sp. SW119]|uniref:DUF1028 domain-containing protein n=1 Tax=Pararhodobacter sp. SW119 TaxID=2780075 RepID=UPI001AE05B7D|nr:DUF1028 domain-containing protein [Pararhodobacter sp. SW119]
MSILARDPRTGLLGGAAMTGNLCVGAWVLWGDSRTGIAATQGEKPSTIWADEAFDLLRADQDAQHVVDQVTAGDHGSAWRQMSLLCRSGTTGLFTGEENRDWKGALVEDDLIVAGNTLSGRAVVEAARDAFLGTTGLMVDRLLAGLRAAAAAGGDSRGIMSASLLAISDDEPPLDVRIDWSETPIEALSALIERARRPDYARWVSGLPVRTDPERHQEGAPS